jgi:hypothetical protein
MSSPLPTNVPRLPSRRASAILAAAMLTAGIVAGIAIGPGPAASFAASSRASALARVLALIALGEGTGAGSAPLLSATAAHPPAAAPQPTLAASKVSTSAGPTGHVGSSAGSASPSSPSSPAPSSPSSTPAPAGAPAPKTGSGSSEKAPTPLPPIAHAWLIALPYGASFANALGQPSAAPYLDGELVQQGTLLSGYSSLAGGQLAGAATLLSGQVTAGVNWISPPPCGAAAGAQAAPCPSAEPAGLQAADGFLSQVVSQIEATADYREHGLIVVTFLAPNQEGSTPGSPTTPATGSAISYPAGTLANTLTATGQPTGVLLLSPFLRHAGARVATTFDPISPRKSLAGLLGVHPG